MRYSYFLFHGKYVYNIVVGEFVGAEWRAVYLDNCVGEVVGVQFGGRAKKLCRTLIYSFSKCCFFHSKRFRDEKLVDLGLSKAFAILELLKLELSPLSRPVSRILSS